MSDINPKELCDKCAANYAKCLNVGNNRYYICRECLRKPFPEEPMTQKPIGKDELIQQWQMAYEHEEELTRLGFHTANAEQLALAHGASRMYDHRQKEIDAVNRWWASRWQTSHDWWYGPNGLEPSRNEYNLSDEQLRAVKEMDAAAAKVMGEVEGYTCYKCGLQMKGRPYHYVTEICEGKERQLDVCVSCFDYEANQ